MRNLFFFLVIAVLFSSCRTLVPYTEALEKKYNLSDKRAKLQFYASEKVVLEREFKDGSVEIHHGKIKTRGNRKIEVVSIRRHLKGALIGEETKKMKIGFEQSDVYFLSFIPNDKGTYVVAGQDWKNETGTVHYGVQPYQLVEGKYVNVLVDLRKILNYDIESRRAKGRKVE